MLPRAGYYWVMLPCQTGVGGPDIGGVRFSLHNKYYGYTQLRLALGLPWLGVAGRWCVHCRLIWRPDGGGRMRAAALRRLQGQLS